jgi:DNA-binding SARP family transcriptional activator
MSNPAVSPLTIQLFGPMDVQCHGAPLPRLRSRNGLWLLALLALRHGREVERAWLAGTLWPDTPTSQGLALLRRELTDLRRPLDIVMYAICSIGRRADKRSRAFPEWAIASEEGSCGL